MGHLLLEHLKGWPPEGVLQNFFFFFENALSGSIHSTYQLASLQTDQNPTLGLPRLYNILFKQVLHVCWIMTRTGHSGQYLEYFSEAGPSVSTSDRFLLLSFRMKEVILLSVLRVREVFLSSCEPPVTKGSNEGSRRFYNHG